MDYIVKKKIEYITNLCMVGYLELMAFECECKRVWKL